APTPTPSAPVVAAPPAPAPSLPAETVTTVSPTAETSTAAPQPLLPAPQAAPPPPSAAPGTVTYQITGNRQLLDLVTVIYTDAQGALQTDVNVALPWSKTVVLDPGVTLSSVTATSVGGQLNCSITDANGNLIAVQNSNSMITNCTR
ncbi:MmpS family transport accessory protein, partial [Mycolicibacterium sp.]